MMIKLIAFITGLYLTAYPVYSQYTNTDDRVTTDAVKSVKLHRSEWNLSYPVITLGSDEKLTLGFDLLGNNIETYYYTFEHCDKDWKVTGLTTTEFIDGFAENQIEDYSLSFNTKVNYVHYNLEFPNRNVQFRISGNYIIRIYPAGDPEHPVITRRFMVNENRVSVDAAPQRPKLTAYYNTHQQIDFTVKHPGMVITDPSRTIFATILQNGCWEISKSDLRPTFIRSDELVYNDLSGDNIFPGISEFRYFDIKSIRYQSEYIKSIGFNNGIYSVLLTNSENRSARPYFYWQDLNGKYYTAVQEGRDHETESDYLQVSFTLPSAFPVRDGNVYIWGELTGWSVSDRNKMIYNAADHAYECTLLLKQGWYNYLYAVSAGPGSGLDFEPFEGNHFETENDYLILIYFRDPMGRYDRLVGSRTVNSVNK